MPLRIALGDEDPALWHRLARETLAAALHQADTAGVRRGLRLYDGAWWRCREFDPARLAALEEDLAQRLAAVDTTRHPALADEIRLRRMLADGGFPSAAELLDRLAATLPAATRERLASQCGRVPLAARPREDGLQDLRAEALRGLLELKAEPMVAELREAVAAARGPDRREQSYDSYDYKAYRAEEWGVSVPFAALPLAERALVPVAAAERILGLPELDPATLRPWERPPPGRAYRRYWAGKKRFLALVAEIAARFAEDGGARLARELRLIARRLDDADREAVELHLATLGLLDRDPAPLAERVLGAADGEELGGRGELLLQALRSLDGVGADERRRLLADAGRVARRTTAFMASNPYASAVEAMAREDVADLDELVELVDRAAQLKFSDWEGWERALHALSRSLAHLARGAGGAVARQAIAALRGYARSLPSLEATCLLAGARGAGGEEGVDLCREALAAARSTRPTVEVIRAEIEAIALLAESGAEGAVAEMRQTADRLHFAVRGRAEQVGLQALAGVAARLETGTGERLREALALADSVRDCECRWLAYVSLGAASGTPPEVSSGCAAAAGRTARRWLLRRSPFDVLVPLTGRLVERLGCDLRDPAVRGIAALAAGAASGALAGRDFAAAFMGLAPSLGSPAAVAALFDVVDEIGPSWWRLPLLALAGDGVARWLVSVADEQAGYRPVSAPSSPSRQAPASGS